MHNQTTYYYIRNKRSSDHQHGRARSQSHEAVQTCISSTVCQSCVEECQPAFEYHNYLQTTHNHCNALSEFIPEMVIASIPFLSLSSSSSSTTNINTNPPTTVQLECQQNPSHILSVQFATVILRHKRADTTDDAAMTLDDADGDDECVFDFVPVFRDRCRQSNTCTVNIVQLLLDSLQNPNHNNPSCFLFKNDVNLAQDLYSYRYEIGAICNYNENGVAQPPLPALDTDTTKTESGGTSIRVQIEKQNARVLLGVNNATSTGVALSKKYMTKAECNSEKQLMFIIVITVFLGCLCCCGTAVFAFCCWRNRRLWMSVNRTDSDEKSSHSHAANDMTSGLNGDGSAAAAAKDGHHPYNSHSVGYQGAGAVQISPARHKNKTASALASTKLPITNSPSNNGDNNQHNRNRSQVISAHNKDKNEKHANVNTNSTDMNRHTLNTNRLQHPSVNFSNVTFVDTDEPEFGMFHSHTVYKADSQRSQAVPFSTQNSSYHTQHAVKFHPNTTYSNPLTHADDTHKNGVSIPMDNFQINEKAMDFLVNPDYEDDEDEDEDEYVYSPAYAANDGKNNNNNNNNNSTDNDQPNRSPMHNQSPKNGANHQGTTDGTKAPAEIHQHSNYNNHNHANANVNNAMRDPMNNNNNNNYQFNKNDKMNFVRNPSPNHNTNHNGNRNPRGHHHHNHQVAPLIHDNITIDPHVSQNTDRYGYRLDGGHFGMMQLRMKNTGLQRIHPRELFFEAEIGRGSSAMVYKGLWKQMEIASKKFQATTVDSRKVQQYLQTVSEVKDLYNHKNVLFTYAYSYEFGHGHNPGGGGSPFILVTEYMSGGSVQKFISRDRPGSTSISILQRIELIVQAAHGIQHLHKSKFIHRDIAARNLLMDNFKYVQKHINAKSASFDDDGGLNDGHHHNSSHFNAAVMIDPNTKQEIMLSVPRVVICDYGLCALLAEDAYQSFANIVALKWRSPEIIESDKYSLKSDVYAFGITMWEIITGQDPYSDVNPVDTAIQVLVGGKRPQSFAFIPNQIQKLMKHCWDKTPENRPDFDEIVARLEKFIIQEIARSKARDDADFF